MAESARFKAFQLKKRLQSARMVSSLGKAETSTGGRGKILNSHPASLSSSVQSANPEESYSVHKVR